MVTSTVARHLTRTLLTRRLKERIQVTVTDEADIVSVTNRAGSPELLKRFSRGFLLPYSMSNGKSNEWPVAICFLSCKLRKQSGLLSLTVGRVSHVMDRRGLRGL